MSAGLAPTFWQKTRWPQAALIVSVVLLGFATSPAAMAQNISLTRGGHTYILYKDAVTYSEAYAAAQQVSVGSESGYLMIIDDASENASIRNWLSNSIAASEFTSTSADDGGSSAYVWLAGSDASAEGQWYWQREGASGFPKLFWQGDYQSGQSVGEYTNWGTIDNVQQEPDNFENQDALAFALQTWPNPNLNAGFELGVVGQWNDVDSSNQLFYVVEVDAVEGDTSTPSGEIDCTDLSYEAEDGQFNLEPSGGDDTALIACAIEAATEVGVSTIKLGRGAFYSGPWVARDFRGTLSGVSKSATILELADGSIDCSASSSWAPGGFRFEGGDVKVRAMTITSNAPCAGGGASDSAGLEDFAVLEFTPLSCEQRTHFAQVDRVDIISTASAGPTGIAAMSAPDLECAASGSGSLGTFKFNRSTVLGYSVGVLTTLGGAGQVDINFNTFTGVDFGVEVVNANQSSTITGNTFEYNFYGVVAYTSDDWAPDQNRSVVHNNRFTHTGAESGVGVLALNNSVRAEHSLVVTNNAMFFPETGIAGVYMRDMDAAVISRNEFSGSAEVGIYIGTNEGSAPAEDNIISGNVFELTTTTLLDILLTSGTSNTLVGSQGARVGDEGENSVLDQ